MTLKLLVDTCVWLDLAKDFRQQPVISAIEHLVESEEVELLVPQTVLDEFRRNKERVAADAKRSLQSHFSLVRDAMRRFGDENGKDAALKALDEADHAALIKSEAVNASIDRIERLLTLVSPLPITDAIKIRVTERAMAQRAPFHQSKNSVGDAIIIETYSDQVGTSVEGGTRFAFVTHNYKDFGRPIGDRREPHEDISAMFEAEWSSYWISLVDLLHDIDEDLLPNFDLEFNGAVQPRRLSEILEAEHLLFRQVWYNRHWNLRASIEEGKCHVVSEENYSRAPYRPDQILDTIWAGALEAAKRTEDEVGLENLGPWDDFEWGMINGKLSALRWLLGDEWDMLDT